jgi:FAD/FMN-containing dehydrogenase
MTVAGRRAAYERERERLVAQYTAIPPGAPVRLAKKTSNLFRARSAVGAGLDVSGLSGVLEVDARGRTADVLGMTTYEELVDATLRFGLMPLVVPQLKTITLGGAVAGLGVESTSFRDGLPHESVLELEALTGDGRIVVATAGNEHAELLAGFPNSYGTLGYALRLRIELAPVHPYVALRHVRFRSAADLAEVVDRIGRGRDFQGEPVDFCDGTWFGPTECYLTLGRWSDEAPGGVSDYGGRQIYYQSLRRRDRDVLTVRDYLWRWDTDWFWCSRSFGVQRPAVRQLIPRRWLRSDVYWRLFALERRYGVKRGYDRWRGRPEHEDVVQDVEVPVARLAEFLDVFGREVPISPAWLCPVRVRAAPPGGGRWPLYPLEPAETYVNVGFWAGVPLAAGEPADAHNRLVERLVADLGGLKSLYSSAHYDADEFWATYGGEAYRLLKKRYDPGGRLLDLYEKAVRGR